MGKKSIEVEIRSFVEQEKFEELLVFFAKNAELIKEDCQETYYFDSPEDLRIQKGRHDAKVWLKKGKIHDEAREEIELRFGREDFEKAERLFLALGYGIEIKWFRERRQYDWQGVKACLDFTKGYGYILELEMMADENDKEAARRELKRKMAELGVTVTPREEFENRFEDYKRNWRRLAL